jgi:hypothetical protein
MVRRQQHHHHSDDDDKALLFVSCSSIDLISSSLVPLVFSPTKPIVLVQYRCHYYYCFFIIDIAGEIQEHSHAQQQHQKGAHASDKKESTTREQNETRRNETQEAR